MTRDPLAHTIWWSAFCLRAAVGAWPPHADRGPIVRIERALEVVRLIREDRAIVTPTGRGVDRQGALMVLDALLDGLEALRTMSEAAPDRPGSAIFDRITKMLILRLQAEQLALDAPAPPAA